jgi:ABC-type multidrug transport system ATPase subunit
MEEAETLCDRLCIMVDGSLQCIDTPKEVFFFFKPQDYLMIECKYATALLKRRLTQ